MKVYCLFACFKFEGNELCGVFSTREKAEQAHDKILAAHEMTGADDWDISEIDVDSLFAYGKFLGKV